MIESADTNRQAAAVIKVIGVGGCGGNTVQHMLSSNIEGVEFIYANTDVQALKKSTVKTQLQLGRTVTKGLGAGGDPEVGRQAALEDRDCISDVLQDADMVFIAAGMGGGTGTGAAPVVAQVARDMGILTVAVVTRPFKYEGSRKAHLAEDGITEVSELVDSLIVIPNENLLSFLGKECKTLNAFAAADDILLGAVQGITDLIVHPGRINIDFADVKSVMSEKGMAIMCSGKAQGENRALIATEAALSSPLLENVSLSGARGMLVNILSGEDATMEECAAVGEKVDEITADKANVKIGMSFLPEMNDEIQVTIVATGFGRQGREDTASAPLSANVKRAAPGEIIDYKKLERPTVMRNNRKNAVQTELEPIEDEQDFLDVPSFLRRQAD